MPRPYWFHNFSLTNVKWTGQRAFTAFVIQFAVSHHEFHRPSAFWILIKLPLPWQSSSSKPTRPKDNSRTEISARDGDIFACPPTLTLNAVCQSPPRIRWQLFFSFCFLNKRKIADDNSRKRALLARTEKEFYWRWTVHLHSSISGYGISISLKQANFSDPQKKSSQETTADNGREKDCWRFGVFQSRNKSIEWRIYGLICFVWTIGDENLEWKSPLSLFTSFTSTRRVRWHFADLFSVAMRFIYCRGNLRNFPTRLAAKTRSSEAENKMFSHFSWAISMQFANKLK